mmetsp:Transcript_9835/g.24266  ORF Transcript_9835/g.24266 Transcript_9835/m.24266 type:complete len:303 (-) Transcript_9835:46-954(-)
MLRHVELAQIDGVAEVERRFCEGDAGLVLAERQRGGDALHGLDELVCRLLELDPALGPLDVDAVTHTVTALKDVHVDLGVAQRPPRQQLVPLNRALPLGLVLLLVIIITLLLPLLRLLLLRLWRQARERLERLRDPPPRHALQLHAARHHVDRRRRRLPDGTNALGAALAGGCLGALDLGRSLLLLLLLRHRRHRRLALLRRRLCWLRRGREVLLHVLVPLAPLAHALYLPLGGAHLHHVAIVMLALGCLRPTHVLLLLLLLLAGRQPLPVDVHRALMRRHVLPRLMHALVPVHRVEPALHA